MAYFNFFYKVNSSQFPNHCDRFFKGLWALICSIKYWFHFFLERNQSPVQIQNWFALPGHYPYKHFNQFCPFHQPYPELIFGGTNHCPGYWKAENLFHELISMQLIFFHWVRIELIRFHVPLCSLLELLGQPFLWNQFHKLLWVSTSNIVWNWSYPYVRPGVRLINHFHTFPLWELIK